MIDATTKQIADGLAQALVIGDDQAIIGGMSALSLHLGGLSLIDENIRMAPHGYVLYIACLAISAMAPEGPLIVNLHGVPTS